MKTIIASIAGVDDRFFEIVWDNFPNAAFALFCVVVFVVAIFKVLRYFMELKLTVVRAKETLDVALPAFKTELKGQVIEVKEQINKLEVRLVKELDRIDKQFEKIDSRFEKIDERFEKIDERFIRVDEQFKKVDERLGAVETKVAIVDAKVDVLTERFDRLENKMDKNFDIIINLLGVKPQDAALSHLRKSD
jgi:chromosome segregation ATPase